MWNWTRRTTARLTAWLLRKVTLLTSDAAAVSTGYMVGKGALWVSDGLRPERLGAAARVLTDTVRLFWSAFQTGLRR